jgi:hypothetical protein
MLVFLFALAVAIPSALHATIEKLTTLAGKTYRQCEIFQVHPDGVSFTHAKGAAKVLFTDLPKEWRDRLGYDPKKAAAYAQGLEEKRRKEEEARAEIQKQRAQALLVAQQMELARLRIAEEQTRAAVRAAEVNGAFAVQPAVPLLPALGAVFDSRDYRYGRYRGGSHLWGAWPSGYTCGNGVYYGLSSGYYPLNFAQPSVGWTVNPPPPAAVRHHAGKVTFQVKP